MKLISRRNFLSTTAGIFTASSYARIAGANERVNVGFIGTGEMGRANLSACKSRLGTAISWICDVYDESLEGARELEPRARITKDFRRVLDDKETDAVAIATPDHWHALMTVEAFKSGKDVYCEKPIAHRVNEIPVMVEACEKYGRIFQSGQWQHSGNQFMHAITALRLQEVGKILRANTWFYSETEAMKFRPDSMPPQGLDWNMWLGPAPLRPFNSNRFLFNFRWYWDYANGMFGDWLPHMTDIAEWGLKTNELKQKTKGPFSVRVISEPVCIQDSRDTPTMFLAEYDFGRQKIIADYNGCGVPIDGKRDWGIEWTCEYGSIFVDRDVCQFKNRKGRKIYQVETDYQAGGDHWQNFIDCVRDRSEPRASLNKVARTNLNCLLTAAVYRYSQQEGLGNAIKWNPKKMTAKTKKLEKYLEFDYRPPWKLSV